MTRIKMSWIKKALERARSERSAGEGAEGGLSSAAGGACALEGKPVPKPIYSRTRVLPVPEAVLLENRIVAADESHAAAEQFKLLRTRIFQQMRPLGLNTLQVTGFRSREGKSTVAVNLAISIARDVRQTTLLVDLDFRRPAVHRLLALGDSLPGLKSFFLDGMPLQEVFVSPGIEKLTVLPAGGRVVNPTEMIGSPGMEALVKELKGRYPDRFIVFDTPPVTECPDPLVFSDYVDAVLLVARADHTQTDQVKAAMDLLPREKLLGVVLNDASIPDLDESADGKETLFWKRRWRRWFHGGMARAGRWKGNGERGGGP